MVHEPVRIQALLLVGSSYVMHTYQLRPFSNSIEAILVALSLVLVKNLLVGEINPNSFKVRLLAVHSANL